MKIVVEKNSNKGNMTLEFATSFKVSVVLFFFFGIFFINEFWMSLEQHFYGEVQQRVVDDIICCLWILFAFCAYIIGYKFGKKEKGDQANVYTEQHS